MCAGPEVAVAAEVLGGAEAFGAGMAGFEALGAAEGIGALGGAEAFGAGMAGFEGLGGAEAGFGGFGALEAGNELYGTGGQLLGGDLAGQSLAAMGYDTVGGMGYNTIGNIAESYTGAPIGTEMASQYGNFDQAMQGMQEGFKSGSAQALAPNPQALQYAQSYAPGVGADIGAGFDAGAYTAPDAYGGSAVGQAAELAASMGSSGPSFMSSLPGWAQGAMQGMPNLGAVGQMASIGSGLYGMSKADQMRQMALDQSRRADPWGQSGGRSQAGAQLQNLLSNPNSITSMPGYEAGLTAVQRKMASQGYQNSGNMMAALQDYGGNFYNNAVTQLGGLAGAGYNPAGAGQLAIQGTSSANDLAGRSMASIGYGTVGNALTSSTRPWWAA